jgi:hypothetical protein
MVWSTLHKLEIYFIYRHSFSLLTTGDALLWWELDIIYDYVIKCHKSFGGKHSYHVATLLHWILDGIHTQLGANWNKKTPRKPVWKVDCVQESLIGTLETVIATGFCTTM